MKIFLKPLIAALCILSSCDASNKEKPSLEIRNATSREITKIVVFSEVAERGVEMLYIVPSGLKSWYPFDIQLNGSLSIKVWWSAEEMADCSVPITKQDEEIIKSHKYLVVVVRELDLQLLTGDDPDKADAIKTVRLKFSKDNGHHE